MWSRARWLAPPLALLAGACDDSPREIDPFPVRFDLSRGPAVVAVDVGDGPVPAILDTLAALTVIDPFRPGQPIPDPRRRKVTVTLLGLDQGGDPVLPRARFPDTGALELHPCPADDPCRVGLADDAVEFGAVLGADLLGRNSVRIDFPTSQARFFPDASGSDAQLTSDCQAVISGAFAGGGTLAVAGTEVSYAGRRPALGACVDVVDAPDDVERGTDMLLLVSTGIGVSILSASAYDRYAAAAGATPRAMLPAAELFLTSGPAPVGLAEIGRLALVGGVSDEESERGPCRELHLNRLMSVNACEENDIRRCPCPNEETFCRTAAAVDLTGPVEVAVLDDDHPLFQSLRDELRPDRPEVDGIIGARALSSLRIEFDYPNGRMVMRCLVQDTCVTRPQVRARSSLADLARCRGEDMVLPDAGIPMSDAGAADGG